MRVERQYSFVGGMLDGKSLAVPTRTRKTVCYSGGRSLVEGGGYLDGKTGVPPKPYSICTYHKRGQTFVCSDERKFDPYTHAPIV